MQARPVSGGQIALFTFAGVALVGVLWRTVDGMPDWDPGRRALLKQAAPLIAEALILLCVPFLRRWCRTELAQPIPRGGHREAALVAVGMIVCAFGVAGAMAGVAWLREGPAGLSQLLRGWGSHDAEMRFAFSGWGIARWILIGVILAPILEELLFRGLLYKAWARQWGWIRSSLLTAVLFAAYHLVFGFAFVLSLVLVCLYRRTGSLRAAICVHAAYNFLVSYPLLGQFITPRTLEASSEPSSWSFHFACLLALLIGLPIYMFMSRTSEIPAFAAVPHEPLPHRVARSA